MAPNVTLHFFASNDLNGDPLAELTDESPYFKGLKLKLERDGLGGAELILQRAIDLTAIDEGAFNAEVFVRLIVHAYSDEVYYPWGWFFSKRELTVIHRDEDGGEEYHLGGPGPKQYLTRGILGIGSPNTGWNLDLANGVWRWGDSATVGTILRQIISQDAHEDDPAFPDLTRSFDDDTDSAGVAWADTDISAAAEQYRIPIGTSLLQALWDLDDIVELTSTIDLGTVGAPEFRFNVSQGLGLDVTGSDPGADVCILREGLNITNDSLTVKGATLRKASHVVVEGLEGVWAEAIRPAFSPGNYVKRVKIEYRRTKTPFWLEKAGLRWLKRQDYGENAIAVEILPGADDPAGYYFPAPDRVLWLSNQISLDSSADGTTKGHLDYSPSDPQLVTGFEITLGPAGDTTDLTTSARSWEVTVNLNVERPGNVPSVPNQNSAGNNGGGGGNDPRPIALCDVGTADIDPVAEETTLLKFFDANDAGGDTLDWVGILANQAGGAEGSAWYYFKSTAPNEWSTSYGGISPGQHVRITGWVAESAGERLKFAFTTASAGTVNPAAQIISAHTLRTGPASQWTAFVVDLTAPAGTVSWVLGRDGGGPAFDRVRVYTVDVEASPGIEGDPGDCPADVGLECDPGTRSKASRCDHVHAHGNLSDDEAHHHNIEDIEGGGGAETWEDVVSDLSGKVHRWKFEEASGNFADSIGSLTLTANGSITYQAASPVGFAASFTGGYAESSGLGSIPTGDAERSIVIVWKKTSEGTVANPFPLFGYGAAGATRQLFQLFGTAYATLRFGVLNVQIDASTPIGDGEWHISCMSHIAATRQLLSAYFDGAQQLGTEGGNLGTSTANNFHVAAEFDDTDPSAITVADVIVFDRYLGKPEMDRLYTAMRAGL